MLSRGWCSPNRTTVQAVTIILLNNLIVLNDIKISYIEIYNSAKISYLRSMTADETQFYSIC